MILCYHGTSLLDEHIWNPSLYIDRALLQSRLSYLRRTKCAVLPLGEGLERLKNGTLPPRSVSLTYDDGTFDFYKVALPILRDFNYPVTLYLTTYYSYFNEPVFDVMCSYLLWKGRNRSLRLPEVFPDGVNLNGPTDAIAVAIKRYAIRNKLSGTEKNLLLSKIAAALGIDYDQIRSARLLHLMAPREVADAVSQGVDIQLHTHRHRVYDSKIHLARELEDNREYIASITGGAFSHFCYPGGFYLPEFPDWLREMGIVSAVTCKPGLATKSTNPLLLPRLVDTSILSQTEFAAWISGVASLLPQQPYEMSDDQLVRSEGDGEC